VAALLFSGYDHGVDHLIVNGRLVVQGGRLAGFDEEKIRVNAEKAALRLYTKAGVL